MIFFSHNLDSYKVIQMTKQKRATKQKKAEKLPEGCKKMTTKHYTKRDSPAYPATPCCGEEMTGNDGQKYVSKRASDGSCRWHPMTTRSKGKKTKASCE